jgi:hypothetical protein
MNDRFMNTEPGCRNGNISPKAWAQGAPSGEKIARIKSAEEG